MHERRVFFLVTLVPEGNHVKIAKPGGKIGDGGDPNTYVVFTRARAIMVAVLVQ
jgi:hypothetical protein